MLAVEGLSEADAGVLLASALTAPLDLHVRDRIVAETRGNPLALLELPRDRTPAELAVGFGVPVAASLSGTIEESFARRAAQLPVDTQRLLLVAAADLGDPDKVLRAAALLDVDPDAAAAASEAGLLDLDTVVRFRHPLVRSAVYRSAAAEERRRVHRALADATDAEHDPDPRTWHLAALRCSSSGRPTSRPIPVARPCGACSAPGPTWPPAPTTGRATCSSAAPRTWTIRPRGLRPCAWRAASASPTGAAATRPDSFAGRARRRLGRIP